MNFISVSIQLTLLICLFEIILAQNCSDSVFDSESSCEQVTTWSDFAALIEDSVDGDILYLCPFDVLKSANADPVKIGWSLSVICVSSSNTDGCSIKGDGEILNIESSGNTLIQGLTFRDGDDHAIHFTSTDGSDSAIHTICFCEFKRMERTKTTRGGALMTQSDTGTIYVISSSFTDNFSATRGAAIYVRSKEVVVINSEFIDNKVSELGGAIFCTGDSNLILEGSTFVRNFDKDRHAVVVQPRVGNSVWTDGGMNSLIGGNCKGFFLQNSALCQEFLVEPQIALTIGPSSQPSLSPTSEPTSSPTNRPTVVLDFSGITDLSILSSLFQPRTLPTKMPTLKPTLMPTAVPTSLPTSDPTSFPTLQPTFAPTNFPTIGPTVTTAGPSDTLIEPRTTGFFQEQQCAFEETSDPCIEISSFEELQSLVESNTNVKLCGGFNLLKLDDQVIELVGNKVLTCEKQCTIYGRGTHIKVSGFTGEVVIHNMKFMLSDESAIRIVTSSSDTVASLCSTEFQRNEGYLGGAIFIGTEAGTVNIVDSLFINNGAVKGAAIFGAAKHINIVKSRFISNAATRAGGAVFTFEGSEVSINATTFALNRVTSSLSVANNYAVVVEAGDSDTLTGNGTYYDLGDNIFVDSGDCEGFFVKPTKMCDHFL